MSQILIKAREARSRLSPSRARKIPRTPKAAQRELTRLYVRKLRGALEASRPLIDRASRRATGERADVADPVVGEQIDGMRVILGAVFGEQNTRPELVRILKRLGKFNAKDMGKILGIDIRADLGLENVLDDWIADNLRLIKKMNRKMIGEIGALLDSGAGLRHEQLAAEIAERFAVSESRAALIARDQVLKKHSRINSERQKSAGIRFFRWVTSGDERVRDTHRALSGQVFSYASPPSVGLPGEPVQCRCTAEPLLEGVDYPEGGVPDGLE